MAPVFPVLLFTMNGEHEATHPCPCPQPAHFLLPNSCTACKTALSCLKQMSHITQCTQKNKMHKVTTNGASHTNYANVSKCVLPSVPNQMSHQTNTQMEAVEEVCMQEKRHEKCKQRRDRVRRRDRDEKNREQEEINSPEGWVAGNVTAQWFQRHACIIHTNVFSFQAFSFLLSKMPK